MASCSLKIYSDFDHDISFARYKTYGWSDKETQVVKNNPRYYTEVVDKVIKREVAVQLKDKGYLFSDLNPDLKLNYHFVLESWTTAVNPDQFGYSYDSYWLNRSVHLDEGRAGTLIIDLMDPKTDFLVWRGWVDNFKSQSKPGKVENQLKKACEVILEKFPDRKK